MIRMPARASKMSRPVGTAGRPAYKAVELGGALRGQGVPYLAFDQAEDEQGQADDGDQRSDAAVVLQVQGGHGQWSLERRVAAFDRFLTLVQAQDLFGVGLVGRKVGQKRVPAVCGALALDRVLVEVPGQGGSAGDRVGAGLGVQVGGHPPIAGDRRQAGGDLGGGGIVTSAQTAFQPLQVIAGPVEFLGPGEAAAAVARAEECTNTRRSSSTGSDLRGPASVMVSSMTCQVPR
jgi:hypothetical protein